MALGNFIAKWGSSPTPNNPTFIASDATRVYVSDTCNSRVQVLDLDLNPLFTFGSEGYGDGEFNWSGNCGNSGMGIAVNANNIFVVDTFSYRVQIFDLSGNYVSKFGSYGTGDNQFRSPIGIALDSTNLYVTDTVNDNFQIFTLDGTFVSRVTTTPGAPIVGAIVNGRIYIADGINDNIVEYDNTGTIVNTISQNGVYDVSSDGTYIYTTYVWGSTREIHVFDLDLNFTAKFGSSGTGDGQFSVPHSIARTGDYLYVSDFTLDRIQKFDGTFSPSTVNITIDVPGGMVSPSGDVVVAPGEDLDITITPYSGYIIQSVMANGSPISPSLGDPYVYSIQGITEDINVVVVFAVSSTATVLEQKTKNIFNSFDEHGVLLDLKRLNGEENSDYKQRLLDVGTNRSNSSYTGLLSGMSRELGLSPYDAVTINVKSGATPVSPMVVVDHARLILYDDYSAGSIDKEIELYDLSKSSSAYTVADLVALIDSSTNFEVVGPDNIATNNDRAFIITHQDNHIEVYSENVPISNNIFLAHDNIALNSVTFSEPEVFSKKTAEIDLSLMNPGEYNIDYATGKVTVKSTPSGDGIVSYKYIEWPFTLKASPVVIKDFNDETFQKRLFIQETTAQGDIISGLPNSEGINLIKEIMMIKGLYWGE